MKIAPSVTYAALLCGLRGIEIEMPGQAVLDCSRPGPADDAVAYWAPRIPRPDTLTPELLRDCLREYGAWEEEQLADDAANWGRAVWSAACNAKEGGDCFPLIETDRDARNLLETLLDDDATESIARDAIQLLADEDDADLDPSLCNLEYATPEDVRGAEPGPALCALVRNVASDEARDALDDGELRVEYLARQVARIPIIPHSIPKDWVATDASPILEAICKDIADARRKRDIRKLCAYLGRPEVADKAVAAGIVRVPQILAL
jgi:hypothetical protein